MIPGGPLFHKPKSILAARNILYATVFLGILSSLIGEFSSNLHNYSSIQGLLTTIVTIGVLLICIRQIGFGKKWARTLFLIFFIIGILGSPIYVPFIFKTSLALGFMFILQLILQILALKFLFDKSSNEWFNRFKTDPVAR